MTDQRIPPITVDAYTLRQDPSGVSISTTTATWWAGIRGLACRAVLALMQSHHELTDRLRAVEAELEATKAALAAAQEHERLLARDLLSRSASSATSECAAAARVHPCYGGRDAV